jgi:hypothetical protein
LKVLFYLCTDWTKAAADGLGMSEPPNPIPATSVRFLNTLQMEAIADCAKVGGPLCSNSIDLTISSVSLCLFFQSILRNSLQRRAVLRAEAAVSGAVDEDDADDELMMMGESMELHFNVSELIGAVFRTHGDSFFAVFQTAMHDVILEMSHCHCLREDRQFSFYVISDVVEFGLSESIAEAYFGAVFPVMLEACASASEAGLRQACAYTFGCAAEQYPVQFSPHSVACLQRLGACVARGEEPGEPRGACTDNAVYSVGVVLEKMESIGFAGLPSKQLSMLWGQWLGYLPLQHDLVSSAHATCKLVSLFDECDVNDRKKASRC